MTEQSNKPSPINAQPTANGDAAVAHDASSAQTPPESRPVPHEARKATRKRNLLAGVLGVVVLAGLLVFGIPWVQEMLSTVSTDDAFVNGHVTFVAPRVAGQISRVLVDDNNRVHKGDLLAELDKEPYQVAVSEKQAAVDIAATDLQAATAEVRGIEAQARTGRWNLQRAVQGVDSQVALLHARVAAVDKSKAALVLAQVEFARAQQLVVTAAVPREEYDVRQAALTTARAELVQTLAEVYQIRASLGLPAQPDGGGDLGQVPPDLDETFSSVLQAQAELIQSAAQLGVVHSFDQGPKAMLDQFEKLGDINTTFAQLATDAPAVKQAEAKLEAARRDLAQAELDLRYCDITADIDGVVTRRNVNPGNYVQVGQNLMAIRSLNEIWVDANFKETQLRDLRIGQPVDLHVDMYGGTHIFKGRVAGFTMGTGSTLALLPPENATGNYVKVVQRLPVRIDLVDYNPDQTPLFIGTSVVPYVYINKPPTGPDAGKFGLVGSANAQSNKTNAMEVPAIKPGTNVSFASLKQVDAGVLNVGYAEAGPGDGPVVFLLHGWPYDIHSYVDVAPLLASAGYRVIVPYARGCGTTRFLSSATVRNGQEAALAVDTIALMDALRIHNATFAGFDWGARTADIIAALWPERCKALVSVSGYLLASRAFNEMPLPPTAEYQWWYQYYFSTQRGVLGYEKYRHDFGKLIWKIASPKWNFDEATFDRTAASFNNPDYVAIVIHNYRWRLSLAAGEPQYDDLVNRLAKGPVIAVPTITLEGDANGAPHADAAAYRQKFSGKYGHRLITGGIGHNLPQEAPQAFAQAVVDVDGYS